jgi:hypothetical protein
MSIYKKKRLPMQQCKNQQICIKKQKYQNYYDTLYIVVCHLPQKTGPCRGSFKKYFYNGATGQCERFTYGGCKGNENNSDSDTNSAMCFLLFVFAYIRSR